MRKFKIVLDGKSLSKMVQDLFGAGLVGQNLFGAGFARRQMAMAHRPGWSQSGHPGQ
ncbi:MAG TPA: hypothetical protein VGC77_16050 [Rhodopseudomonas sp.]|uniref:hypothetical protein n=1 Tax=Rhodopseudomonas sp. TaxID=1078 RepID=UPI002EDA0DBF